MGDKINCFLIRPSLVAEESYRRFVINMKNRTDCPTGKGLGHSASAVLRRVPWELANGGIGLCPNEDLKKDPRWPTHCACGYEFLPDDYWQHNYQVLYRRDEGNDLWLLSEVQAGAMWNADWLTDQYKGPDGLCLVVRTPGGDWTIDGPSWHLGVRGPGWTRTGIPPRITVSPSILQPGYHGWLRDGVLEKA